MKVARLVLGILTIIMGAVLLFSGGSSMIVLALITVAAGIIMIVTHRKGVLGGCIACMILFLIAIIIVVPVLSKTGSGTFIMVLYIILAIFSLIGLIVDRVRR